jgi:serine/threonine protein kinase
LNRDVDEIESTGNMNVVGAELAVSVMLSSLVRRGVCPNFVVTRGVFSCPFKPPENIWGSADNKRPKGNKYESPKTRKRLPKEPKASGRYQYIRMELCDAGDAEEFLKAQPDEALPAHEARQLLFQIAYALHAAADRFSLKHYDVKLLNVFLQRAGSVEKSGDVVMRYGLGEHTFALRSPNDRALVAKLADYGTANVEPASTGQPVTIAQFTTMENSPPDFFMLGDKATQGHGHDNFGLGLCMLHLFTGRAPYEEILEELTCPKNLKKKLERLWEDENVAEFSVVRSVILNNVYKDEAGHIIEGEPDEVFYHTLYRYLVLFGIPEDSPLMGGKVLDAIRESLEVKNDGRGKLGRSGKAKRKGDSTDAGRFKGDRNKYSLLHGNSKYISRARQSLEEMDGGLDLLLSLVSFDPEKRATASDVLNSCFMAPLREAAGEMLYNPDDTVYSYNAFSTHY